MIFPGNRCPIFFVARLALYATDPAGLVIRDTTIGTASIVILRSR